MIPMTEHLLPDTATLPRCTTTTSFTLLPDGSVDDVERGGRVVMVQCVEPTGHAGDHTMIDPNTVSPTRVLRAEADADLVEWLLLQLAAEPNAAIGTALKAIVELHGARGAHECPADGAAGVHVDFVTDCLTLRLLALPYADNAGFLQEWRP
jgi:hypothetical protein